MKLMTVSNHKVCMDREAKQRRTVSLVTMGYATGEEADRRVKGTKGDKSKR